MTYDFREDSTWQEFFRPKFLSIGYSEEAISNIRIGVTLRNPQEDDQGVDPG